MDSSGRTCSDLIGLIKSWINWHSEPAHVSRDFWMPDKSCRVCYECDSQFTLFNRRHHCRLCGRIFCTKCTSNWIPAQSFEHKYHLEDWDKIRVCNYCFKQWEQNLAVPADNGVQAANLDLIGTPSATSSVITKSSGTCDNSSVTLVSLSQSAGLSPLQSTVMETNIDTQSVVTVTSVDIAVDTEEQNHSQKQFEFCLASYNEDEEFGESFLDSKRTPYSSDTNYFNEFNHAKLDEIDDGYRSRKVHPGGDAPQNSNNSSVNDSFNSQLLEEIQQIVQKSDENDVSDECEAPSSIYVAADVEIDPVDFEKNGVIWLPPEPEDEEDEREALLFDDDDDVDASGEWGYLRKSNSFGSGEFRNRDKSNEEHKNAMKTVVDTHFRALVAQLLQMENLLVENENDKENWLEIITALSWEAATLLKPDTSKGGQMDPGNYVKVKCLASGHRSDSMVIKGVVCKKNVAHRRMMSKVEKPRVLILGGALEYQRVSNALSSFDTLLQQEMDHLKMAVAKIDAHHPNILLVEKSVSRHAQEYLLAKDISLILNIKRPLLERIARCTGSQIVPSIDHLSSQKLGYCEMFHVEKFLEEHGTAGQGGKKLTKTLMYFEGCPKPLGCTILLRGANGDELKKVKHVVQYGIFAAYHLALETSFLADEGASLPEFPLNNPITVALPDKPSKIDRSISTIPGFTVPDDEKTPGPESVGEPQRSRSAPASDLVKAAEASIGGNEILGKSTLDSMASLEIPSSSSADAFQNSSLNVLSPSYSLEVTGVQGSAHYGELGTLEAENVAASGDRHIDNDFGDSNVKIIQSDSHDLDANMNVPNLSLPLLDEKQNLEMKSSLKDDFPPSPSDHQSILVSLSSRCVWKGTVCERSHLFRIKYYGNFDKPLGRFLRDNLFDQNYRCQSCEMPAEAHIQCYTHRQGTLTISVKKLSEVLLPGEKDGKIWMWHRCLKCPRVNCFPPATRRVVMSDAAWGLSFGKFLELSFSNHAAASRTASCGHSLHRDCLRFYGFGKMVACFRYASIDVHSVYLPPSKLDFSYERQEWIQKELNEVMNWAELLFSEVLNALLLLVERKSVSANGAKTPQTRRQMADLEAMLQKEKKEFEESFQMTLNQGATKGKPDVDILELNRLRRQLIFQSYVWDHRLLYADRLDNNSELHGISITPSESIKKEIAATEKVSLDVNDSVKTGETLIDSGFFAASAKHNKVPDEGLSHVQSVQNNEILHQRNDEAPDSNCGDKNSLLLCAEPKSTADSNTVESDITNGSVLCDGQTSICLSDTLDAAWTGENLQGSDILSSVGVNEKFEVEDRGGKDLNNFLSSDETDNGSIWLGMTFLNFYRSLNKNLLGTAQKLDKILEYDPTYMSLFRESKLLYGPRFFLPVGVNDIVVPVFDDEPTSIISYGLASPEYLAQLSDEFEKPRDITDSLLSMQSLDTGNFRSFYSMDEIILESSRTLGSGDESVLSLTSSRSSLPPLDPLSYSKSVHPRVSFANDGPLGKIKYSVTCYYAKRFEALRRICCPSEVDFIRSLSRCKKWGAQGGKSNVFFAKTLDDRFIIKQVTKTELESFIKFAPGYFKYISESIGTGSPTCLAKILGIYQVAIKHVKGGKESKIDLLVMENLLFGRNITRLYDLKGSSRSRYNPDSTGSNKVLLDQNLIETMPTSPIFVGNKAKRLLERAIWNDTAFLASIDVMDYSLLVGIDEEKHELVVGIIDFMRQYTWDKHLETWVKASGILGGNTSASPTVISPKQYKKRFRKAMTTYFLMVPDQWSPPMIIPSKSQTDLSVEENNNRESSGIAE